MKPSGGKKSTRVSPSVAYTATRGERTDWSLALVRILRDISLRVPEFAHLDPDRIIVTAGQARKRSRATIRPYAFGDTGTRKSASGHLFKPLVMLAGKRMRYEIVLRPIFFLRTTPEERLRALFHELYHLDATFNGTLAEARRHTELPPKRFDAALTPMLDRYREQAPKWVEDLLSINGEVLVLQWLERPPNRCRTKASNKSSYTEKDLFLGPVPMVSRS